MSVHRTVLLKEAIDGLNLDSDSKVAVDATFGGGGHSLEICRRYPKARIIALDQDKSAFAEPERFKGCNISFVNENFRTLDTILAELEVKEIDAIIFDLGLSSIQLEKSGRGFSFMRDEPILMTMKENPRPEDITAREIVNTWEERNLADIIFGYGEEKRARKIAKAIAEFRKKKEIKTTFDLVGIIERAVSQRKISGIHPATKTFQALRIAVNDELGALASGLRHSFGALKADGRMAVISFHSLEDRMVKRFYRAEASKGAAKIITQKPIVPGAEEVAENPRSRSAKLRILKKITCFK